MRSLFSMMVIAMAIVVLPAIAMADGDKGKAKKGHRGHKRPDAKAMFERLDADKDGLVTIEELPERLQKRLGDSLEKADVNGDKKLSKDEFEALMKSRMEAAKAKRGKSKRDSLSNPSSECAKGDKRHHKPDYKAMFARFDTNKDQQLSIEEFTAGSKQVHERIMDHMRKAGARQGAHMRPVGPEMAKKFRAKMDERFKDADKNGDGKLSKEESPDRIKSHFDKIDGDKDGQLTREELKKAFEARRKAMGKGHNHGPKGKYKAGKGKDRKEKAAPPKPPKD